MKKLRILFAASLVFPMALIANFNQNAYNGKMANSGKMARMAKMVGFTGAMAATGEVAVMVGTGVEVDSSEAMEATEGMAAKERAKKTYQPIWRHKKLMNMNIRRLRMLVVWSSRKLKSV